MLNEAGLPDFAAPRKAITWREEDLYFVAFDLLHLNGHDLRDMALEDRRETREASCSGNARGTISRAVGRP